MSKRGMAIIATISFGVIPSMAGVVINLLAIQLTGYLPLHNLISILICLGIGIVGSTWIYKTEMKM